MNLTEKLPSFKLLNQSNEEVSSDQFKGKYLVLYFYPKDDTPGCTKEACMFRDQYASFKDENIEVVGVSRDSVESHAKFHQKHRLNFDLLSDTNGSLAKAMHVSKKMFLIPGRETFVFNPEGVLIHKFNSLFNIEQHINDTISAIANDKK